MAICTALSDAKPPTYPQLWVLESLEPLEPLGPLEWELAGWLKTLAKMLISKVSYCRKHGNGGIQAQSLWGSRKALSSKRCTWTCATYWPWQEPKVFWQHGLPCISGSKTRSKQRLWPASAAFAHFAAGIRHVLFALCSRTYTFELRLEHSTRLQQWHFRANLRTTRKQENGPSLAVIPQECLACLVNVEAFGLSGGSLSQCC